MFSVSLVHSNENQVHPCIPWSSFVSELTLLKPECASDPRSLGLVKVRLWFHRPVGSSVFTPHQGPALQSPGAAGPWTAPFGAVITCYREQRVLWPYGKFCVKQGDTDVTIWICSLWGLTYPLDFREVGTVLVVFRHFSWTILYQYSTWDIGNFTSQRVVCPEKQFQGIFWVRHLMKHCLYEE